MTQERIEAEAIEASSEDRPMDDERLSEAGLARRQTMLGILRPEVVARGRRRVALRAGAGLALATILVVAGGVISRAVIGARTPLTPERIADNTPSPAPPTDPISDASRPEAPPAPAVIAGGAASRALDVVPRMRSDGLSLIRPATADGSIVARAYDAGTARVADATDESLARGLRAAGISAGVARLGEHVMVVPDRTPGEG